MSNVMYNLSQHKATCDGDRSLMSELVRDWDAAKKAIHEQD